MTILLKGFVVLGYGAFCFMLGYMVALVDAEEDECDLLDGPCAECRGRRNP